MSTPQNIHTTRICPSSLEAAIADAFIDIETELGYALDYHTRQSVVDYWTGLVRDAAEKFVRGGLEHNPQRDPAKSWFFVNSKREQRNEVIDLIHYQALEAYLDRHPEVLQQALMLRSISQQQELNKLSGNQQ